MFSAGCERPAPQGFFRKEKVMRRIIPIFGLLFMGIPIWAHGAQPLDELQGHIDQVVSILKDPKYQETAQKDLQREKIWEIIHKAFDFTEMAKRAVAKHWKRFTQDEKKEFSQLFAELLGGAYLGKIQRSYEDEKIIYVTEKMLSSSKALVKTKILRQNTEIPVAYSMRNRNGTWRVYDINIEGVSLVKNYRTQFSKILLKKSPARLIEMLKKKIEREKTKNASQDQAGGKFEHEKRMASLSRKLASKYLTIVARF
jgi:phospholipid transport system substrate-binding protein